MAWNGSGLYVPSNGVHSGQTLWQQAERANRDIRADDMDGWVQDIKTAFENCLTRDSQTEPTVNLGMGGRKHTNVADATAGDEYATWGQVQRHTEPSLVELDDAATIAWDVSEAPVAHVTISGDRTLTISNEEDGGVYVLWVKQDATGSRALTLPSKVDTGALTGTVDMDASSISLLSFTRVFGKLRLTASRGDYVG